MHVGVWKTKSLLPTCYSTRDYPFSSSPCNGGPKHRKSSVCVSIEVRSSEVRSSEELETKADFPGAHGKSQSLICIKKGQRGSAQTALLFPWNNAFPKKDQLHGVGCAVRLVGKGGIVPSEVCVFFCFLR